MFLLIIQSAMFNVYHISIILSFTASTACVGYKITLTTIKLIEFISIYVNLKVYNVISLVATSIINVYDTTPMLCFEKLFVIIFFVSIEDTVIVPFAAHIIIDILHKFEFISIVLSIMDVNVFLIACSVAILIVIVLVYLQNVFIYDINGYFRTHNVRPWVDSCQSIKTIGIAQIALNLMELIVKHQNYVIQKQYHCVLT